MTDLMSFDFTNTSDTGYELLPVGIYSARVSEMNRRVNDKGNIVFEIDFDIASGEFKDRSVRYWQTIVPDKEFTKSQFLQFLYNIEVLTPTDRGEGGMLKVDLELSDVDENGRQRVKTVVVNGEKRNAAGKYGNLHIGVRDNPNTGAKQNWVEKIEKAGSASAQATADQSSSTRPKLW